MFVPQQPFPNRLAARRSPPPAPRLARHATSETEAGLTCLLTTLHPERALSCGGLTRSILFDAVVFDLDGTLVATDRFWIESAERGARRALAALGLTRALPTANQWLSLVGLPLEIGFRSLFPELTDAA